MKIQYYIVGFAIGIMIGLLLSVAEMKFMIGSQNAWLLPFIIGFTVIFSIIMGMILTVKFAKRFYGLK